MLCTLDKARYHSLSAFEPFRSVCSVARSVLYRMIIILLLLVQVGTNLGFIRYVFIFFCIVTSHVGPAIDNDAKSLYSITIIRTYTMTCINSRPCGVNIYKY